MTPIPVENQVRHLKYISLLTLSRLEVPLHKGDLRAQKRGRGEPLLAGLKDVSPSRGIGDPSADKIQREPLLRSRSGLESRRSERFTTAYLQKTTEQSSLLAVLSRELP
jgi:hypothetical protein